MPKPKRAVEDARDLGLDQIDAWVAWFRHGDPRPHARRLSHADHTRTQVMTDSQLQQFANTVAMGSMTVDDAVARVMQQLDVQFSQKREELRLDLFVSGVAVDEIAEMLALARDRDNDCRAGAAR